MSKPHNATCVHNNMDIIWLLTTNKDYRSGLFFCSHLLAFPPHCEQFWALSKKLRCFLGYIHYSNHEQCKTLAWRQFVRPLLVLRPHLVPPHDEETVSRANCCLSYILPILTLILPSQRFKSATTLFFCSGEFKHWQHVRRIAGNVALCLFPLIWTDTWYRLVGWKNIPSTYTLIVHAQAICLSLSGAHMAASDRETESLEGHRTSKELSAIEDRGLLLRSKWHVQRSAWGKPHSLKFLCSVFVSSGFLFKLVEGQVFVSLVCDELSVPSNLKRLFAPENLFCGCSKRSE